MSKTTGSIDPFEKGDVAKEEAAIGRLLSFASDLFWGDLSARLGVDIGDVEAMHMGIYRKLRSPKKVAVFGRNDFKLATRYALIVDRRPITVEALDPAQEDDGRPYDVGAYEPSDDLASMTLLHWDILGDVAVDDDDELRRVGFPGKYARALGTMSLEAREVYKAHLDEIRDRPPELDGVPPKRFVQTLAAFGTYTGGGMVTPGGTYFPKWEPGREGTGPGPANFSKAMLENTTREVVLEAGGDYLLLTSANGYRLLALTEKDGDLSFTEVVGSFDSFHDELAAPSRTKYRAVFFHAINGAKKHDARKRRTYEVTGRGAQRLLLDPRRMVESMVGTGSATASLGIGEAFDWFVEMVVGYFPSRFYVIDVSRSALRPADHVFGAVKGWADESVRQLLAITDPKDPFFVLLDESRKQEILALIARPDVVVLPQAFKMSPRARFVGADHSWCYARDLKTGAVYAMRHGDFFYDLYVGGVSQLVYEGSAGMIPMLVLVFAAAATPALALIAGPAALARFASKEVTRRAVEEIAKDIAKRMVPVLAAQMGSVVASIFIYATDEDDPQGGAHRWKAFAEGVFKGYLVNTIYDSFWRDTISKNLADGIPEYRWYKWARRIYSAVEKVQRTAQTFEEQLDRDSVQQGIALFKDAVGHVGQGVILLLSALYYADYDDARIALEVFGAGPDGEEPPNPAEWELEAGNQLAHIAENISKGLRLEDIDKLLEELRTSKKLSFAVTAAILHPYIWDALKSTWRNRPFKVKKWEVKWIKPARPAIVLVMAAAMVGVLMHLDDQSDGKLGDVASDLLWSMVNDLPGPSVDRAKLNGEIIGNMMGVFAFNSFIHKDPTYANRKKKWGDKSLGEKWQSLMDSPLFGTVMQSGLKIGLIKPILRLIFRRYVSLYRDLKERGVFRTDRTEQTIGQLLSIAEDAALEQQQLGHLVSFKTEQESTAFSLEHLVTVLFRLRSMLARDLQAYLESTYAVPETKEMLEDDWDAFAELAKSSGLSAAVSAHAHSTYVTMATHLLAAIEHLENAIRALMRPFTADRWSWLHLFRELGLDVDIEEAEAVLTREAERLNVFKGAP